MFRSDCKKILRCGREKDLRNPEFYKFIANNKKLVDNSLVYCVCRCGKALCSIFAEAEKLCFFGSVFPCGLCARAGNLNCSHPQQLFLTVPAARVARQVSVYRGKDGEESREAMQKRMEKGKFGIGFQGAKAREKRKNRKRGQHRFIKSKGGKKPKRE